MAKMLEKCPVCDGGMVVRELVCRRCRTQVISEFEPDRDGLSIDPEILDFIKVFIFAEGSIKQSEKILNCSYPKIKNLLKKAKAALGLQPTGADSSTVRAAIIEQLDRGELTVEEALERLKKP
jgi:hypothetical protein